MSIPLSYLRALAFALVTVALSAVQDGLWAAPSATHLRCEYRTDPIAVGSAQPRLSWVVEAGSARGVMQTGYQILVASSPESLRRDQGDLWDTRQVSSEQSLHIVYAGEPLASAQTCYWKVRLWTKDGPSAWSEAGRWTTGLLRASDWHAQWILYQGPAEPEDATSAPEKPLAMEAAPMFRKAFTVGKAVKRAIVFASALGVYELRLNGKAVDRDVLSPGWTDYSKRVHYFGYDVTRQRKPASLTLGLPTG